MSIHHFEELSSGSSETLVLQIRWNDARLVIRLQRASSGTGAPPLENSFIERYNTACRNDDYDEAEALSDEIIHAVVDKGRRMFDQIAPPTGATGSRDLHTFLFPREYTFRFTTLNENAELVREDTPATEDMLPSPVRVDPSCCLPRYSSREIRVLEDLASNGYIAHVQVDGKEMCSKAGDIKGENAAQRELDCLWTITKSGREPVLRVPKLLGLIQTPDEKRIIGFLQEYIPVSDSGELSTLGSIDGPSSIEAARRKKWAFQIQETVQSLHEMGVVWGDGKASNVLIHRDSDDAWVIDFGGGWTDGWLSPELAGTVEGDDAAVAKIFKFLDV
ncbi:hypothetical protein NQ176_g8741 [Zarea fungicola]|uniref:Uncharacterized protein n=1 Tax=Zarea fungicola TaxID=93591 RepID=A0ACC1MQL4_9HYPO|nr:hypothetical protein NQ176_g8741 [Lecanicillium fungicola]